MKLKGFYSSLVAIAIPLGYVAAFVLHLYPQIEFTFTFICSFGWARNYG